jgi:tetratricopeptide (TPR) repeat protein
MEDLLQRYFEMDNSGVGIYFDADEIIELLDYFEETDEFEHFKKVVSFGRKLHPHNLDIKIQTCKVFIFNKKYEKALAFIEHIGDSENQELLLLKCECLCGLDRYDDLTALLEAQLTHADEELQPTFEYLAALLNEQYKSKHAYDLIAHGLALFPDSHLLKEELCFYYETQGELTQALETVKELIDFDPGNPDYWYIQGRLYALMESFDKAIESFDAALIIDETDPEINLLKAFCHYLMNQYEEVVNLCIDMISDGTELDEKIRSFLESKNHVDSAYYVLRKMLEAFDVNQSLDLSELSFYPLENEDKETGISIIADCFPGSLFYLLLKELLLLAEGDRKAMPNIEQLLQCLYLTSQNNKNYRIESQYISCESPRIQVEKILNGQMPDIECNVKDFETVKQIINHLLEGNIHAFCRQYAQCSPQTITEYMGKLFLPGEKYQLRSTDYLFADEITGDDLYGIAANELATIYLTNKNHYN